jgi:two-component system, chemotaxis family, protein-glutamate methylesterase/glutaminase
MTAPSGRVALNKIHEHQPDLVTLDIEMPEMNGLETLRQIRRDFPTLPVIMVSSLTAKGASVTFDALAIGANDYVAKPTAAVDKKQGFKVLQETLIFKIKSLICPQLLPGQGLASHRPEMPPLVNLRPQKSVPEAGQRSGVEAIVLAVSTGGPNALMQLLPLLPADFPVPLVMVQHMPATFTKLFAERLNKSCALEIEEAQDGEKLRAGKVWLAPGDYHVALKTTGESVTMELNQEPAENSCRPAADPLFRSAASIYGEGLLAVVMTGMGSDGLRGCEAVKHWGGQVIVQDKASSVVWGMPGAVAKAGLADAVYSLEDLAPALIERVKPARGAAGFPAKGLEY